MSDETKTPALELALVKMSEAKQVVTPGAISMLLYWAQEDIAAIEARHEEEIRRARREAYEDALAIMSQNHRFFDGMDRAMMRLREKAGKL